MLGLILIYFVGKAFYALAEKHGKQKWLYAILGVLSYYFGIFSAGIALGAVEALNPDIMLPDNDLVLSLMTLPVGVLFCWGFYRLLKYNWEKSKHNISEDLLDL